MGHLSLCDDVAPPSEPALFDALPEARERIAWMSLGRFPTRVERVDGILPRTVELWVKREDECGELYGGNKVRKLEFLFGDARERGCSELVTFGGWGAHHVVATAIYGARHGFDVTAALAPQLLDAHVREQLRVDAAMGARLVFVDSWLAVLPTWARAQLERKSAWLAGGGSSPLGALGWASGACELNAQVADGALPPFDALYVALGSGGTAAGLLWGLRSPDGRAVELVAVRVVGALACGRRRVERLAGAVDALMAPVGGRARGGEPARLRVETGAAGRYGAPTVESLRAVVLASRAGLVLEPIYTGKVLAALLRDAASGRLDGKRVLLVHSHNSVDLTPLVRAP